MDKETVKRLVSACDAHRYREFNFTYEVYHTAFYDQQLLAFAQACFKEGCDYQRKLCVEAYESYSFAISEVADTIRNAKESPESDIEEARRRT